MVTRYPVWKYLVIVAVIALCALYAAPNLFQPDPAIQVAPLKAGTTITNSTFNSAQKALTDLNISIKGSENTGSRLLIRLDDKAQQNEAKEAIQDTLGSSFIVALNLAPTTPEWLANLGGKPMSKGLDLSGGIYFLLEADMDLYVESEIENSIAHIKNQFRDKENLVRYKAVDRLGDSKIAVAFKDEANYEKGKKVMSENLDGYSLDNDRGSLKIIARLTDAKIISMEDYVISQNIETLNNRVNALGVAEASVSRQGRNRIVVELPGIQDTAQAKKLIGSNSNLEFRLEASTNDLRYDSLPFRDENRTARLKREVIAPGSSITNARISNDPQTGEIQVAVELDARGAKSMGNTTKNHSGERMAVVFIEYEDKKIITEVDGKQVIDYKTIETKEIASLSTINGLFSSNFVMTGNFTTAEAADMVKLLKAGSLATPMRTVVSNTIGPSLGAENIQRGIVSISIGFALVFIFMLAYYRLFGVFANIALMLNLLIIAGVMSVASFTLTLPGIAGIVLTVGMAVDANVLIFSRIKEELNAGLSPQGAIRAGYGRAFVTILDANITTFIVAFILAVIGTGAVKGFAITLGIGIMTSMFTSIMVTRALTQLWYGSGDIAKLSIGSQK